MDAPQSQPPALRDRYTAFIERNEVAWELDLAALTLAWVVVSFAVEERAEAAGLVEVDTDEGSDR